MRILSDPHRNRALLIASVNRNLNSEILKFMQPFCKLFEVLQFNSKPTINFAILTYYKAAELAKRCPTDNPVIATLRKEFLMVLNKSFFETSLKAHHWLRTFLDPHFKRFYFCPSMQTKNWCLRQDYFQIETSWVLEHIEQVAADIQGSQDFAPPQKRVRSEVLQDPFNEFRDGAPSRVISDHSANNSCSNEQILRQVCFIIFSISLQ